MNLSDFILKIPYWELWALFGFIFGMIILIAILLKVLDKNNKK